MRYPGFFLTLEGGDGTGKSTHTALLADAVRARFGVRVVTVREPGGTTLGAALRELLLHGEDMAATTEALLYAADRAEHVARVIRPALESGAIVIADRYIDSSIAYQVEGRGLAFDDVVAINEFATGTLWPDLTIVLDLETAAARGRLQGLPDRLEAAGADFHERVRARYLAQARANPERYAVVSAAGERDATHALVLDATVPALEKWAAGR